MQLSNGLLSLTFDDHSGSLVSLRDVRTGEEHLSDTQQATLFRLIVPEAMWQSRFIEANQQTCSFDRQGDRVTLTYHSLRTAQKDPLKPGRAQWQSETLPIRVVITVDLPAGSPDASFEMRIENHSQVSIGEVWFPRLGGWTGYAGPGKDLVTAGNLFTEKPLDPFSSNYVPSQTASVMRWQRRWSVRYPVFSQLPWLDISGGGRGLHIINYMRPIRVGGSAVEKLHDYAPELSLALGWFSNPEIGPGQIWVSPRFGLGVHQGDWHVPARRYRDWLNTWWKPAPSPERLYRMLGVQNIVTRLWDGTPIWPLSAIPKIIRGGIPYGIYDMCIWDYLMLGNQARINPRDIADFPPDEETVLRQALAEARGLGGYVSMLINHRVVSPTSKFFKSGGERGALRMRDGSLRPEVSPTGGYTAETLPHWMGPESVVMCQRSLEFRQAMQGALDKLLEIGFNAFFIDQPFEYMPCYSPEHGHTTPDDTHQAVAEWVGEFRQRLLARFPDSYIIGEMPDVALGPVTDIFWNWGWSYAVSEIGPYGMPPVLNSYVTDLDVDRAQQGFLHGFLLMLTTSGQEDTLEDFPQYGAYIRQLAAVRARTYPFTVKSQFSDVDGLTCEGGQAKLFLPTHPGIRPAVTLINPTDKLSFARVRLQAGAAGIASCGTGQVYALDGTIRPGGRVAGDFLLLDIPLAPRDVAVWELS